MRIISFDTAKTVLVDDNDLGCGAEAKRATVATSALRLCVFAREMPCRSPEHLGMIRSELYPSRTSRSINGKPSAARRWKLHTSKKRT